MGIDLIISEISLLVAGLHYRYSEVLTAFLLLPGLLASLPGRPRGQEPRPPPPGPGHRQEARQPQERRQGRQEAQVLQDHRLAERRRQAAEAAHPAQVRVGRRHEELRGVCRDRLDKRAGGDDQGGEDVQRLLGGG